MSPSNGALRRRHSMWAAVAALAMAITACSSSGTDDTAGDELSSAGSAESVVRFAQPREVLTLHPHLIESNNIPTVQIDRHVFDRLIVRDGQESVGSLAESWETVDPLTWVFHLRDEVTFTNGEPLTADDVVASLEKTVKEAGPLADYWTDLDTVTAIDDTTVQITTTVPKGDMLSSLEMLLIGPADLLEDPDFAEHPIGSGPYTLTEWTRGSKVVLERNPDYWGPEPTVETLEFYEMAEESSRVTALLSGELDVIPLEPDSLSAVEESDTARVIASPSWQYYYLWPNHSKESLANEKVRQAIYHAIDIQSMVDSLFPTTGRIMQAPISQVATDAATLEPYTYDPDLAKQLLADAGYPDGLTLGLQWASGDGPLIRDVATTIAANLGQIGIEVELQERDAAGFVDARENRTYDLSLQRHSGALGNASSTVGRLYTSAEHRIGFSDPTYDAMADAALEQLDPDEQAVAWKEAQQYIWDRAVVFWLVELDGVFGVSNRLADFEPGPDAARAQFSYVELAE